MLVGEGERGRRDAGLGAVVSRNLQPAEARGGTGPAGSAMRRCHVILLGGKMITGGDEPTLVFLCEKVSS